MSTPYAPGAVVAGRFEIERLAGEGGMGSVYYARDRERGEHVALKILRGAGAVPEARTLLELAHPSIVRCIAFGATEAGEEFLATEWLEGETLRERLARGPIPLAQVLRIARRIAEGLAAAHAWGITHRDVTPANIMMVSDAEAKLFDFGIAVHGRAEGSAGTVGYAAPEQARGESPTPRADVFSLGCVIYEALLGEKPFAAESDVGVIARMLEGDTARVTSRLRGVPTALVALLARMLASDPELRPRDGAAVAAELALLAPTTSTSSLPSSRSVTDAEARAAQVLVAETDAADGPRVLAELEALGARVSRFGRLLVCAWSTESSAAERAVRGARAALAVRRSDAHARASLVAATSDASGTDAAQGSLPDAPSVRVDADTARLLGDRFVVRPEPSGDLVLVREGRSGQSRTSLLGHETRCIGRDREIGLVVSTFEECREEPDARVVWVTGAPGIGKTRVRDEVLARISGGEGAPRVWSAQPDPTRASVVLGVVADLVRSAAAVARDDDAEHQRASLESRACTRVPEVDRPRVVEFLSELLGLGVPEASAQLRAAREEPLLMGDQMRRAFEDLVLAELSRGPLALVIEDLQWADAASVRAVSDVARASRGKPLFVLLLGRPEAKDSHLRLVADRQPTGVALGKLGQKAMEKLVAEALAASGASDPSLAASIAQRSGGNPFFAEELVRAARAGRGETSLAALAVLESRLTALEPEARRVLRAASVFGQQFSSADVAALLGDEAASSSDFVDAWCAWLAEREVLAQSGGLWTFRHALVRDAAYAMLPDADRATAHALAAEHLERLPRAHGSRVAGPAIAEHWSRAGEPARAARWLASSAQGALEANDLSACVDLGERALAALGAEPRAAESRGELLVVLAEAHRWRGEYERSAACARDAITLLPSGGARFFRAVAELASIAGTVGPPEEFESAIEKLAAAHVDPEGVDSASIAWCRAGMQLLVRGDARADAMLARADAAASSDLARGRVERAYALRAEIHGDLEELVRRSRASIAALERAGDVRSACVEELNLAAALCELGCDDDARARIDHGAREAEARGLIAAVALASHLDGILLARAGRTAEAIAAQRRALATFASQGNTRMEGGVRCHLAELLLREGRGDEALAEATRASELLASAPPARARALAILATVHVALRHVEPALAAAEEAAKLAEVSGVESGEAIVHSARAAALAASGSPDASAARELGRAKLRARAAAIADPALREAFLRVPENAMLLASP